MQPPIPPSLSHKKQLKLLTYNVHSCIGTDRRLEPERIAEVIASLEPDIIGLQELDVGRRRTGGIDQAHVIASLLKMEFHFHAALSVKEERYGDAILTALPAKMVNAGPLPSVGEQRGALWIEVEVDGRSVQVFNTHLGLTRRDRVAQATALSGAEWLGHPRCKETPVILLGDFNSIRASKSYKLIARHLKDVRQDLDTALMPTYPSRFPLLRLDHIFVSHHVRVVDASVPATPLTRMASDHLPLLATVEISWLQ
jgi:endonuclease/exonuclease/phosphatase family metal-dependent hydrolase